MFNVVVMTVDFNKSNIAWYLDSGAFKHVTRDCNKLYNIKETKDIPNIQSATCHMHVVQGKGKKLVTCNGETKKVSDVFYVLGINKKLLSVGAIINKGYAIIFGSQKCCIVTTNLPSKLIAKGECDKSNGLYKLASSN